MVELSSLQPNDLRTRDSMEDLRQPLKLIESVSRKSDFYSSLAGLLTSLNFSVLFLSALSMQAKFLEYKLGQEHFYQVIVCSSALIFFLSALVLNKFEKLISLGNAYYQEISDSMEWENIKSEFRIASRMVLKRFVLSSKLPFYRTGSNGPFVYISLNGLVSAMTVFMVLVFQR